MSNPTDQPYPYPAVRRMHALEFDRLAIVDTGHKLDDLPYWMVSESIAFRRSVDGTIEILIEVTEGLMFKRAMPHHVWRECQAGASISFGRARQLTIGWDIDRGKWLVVGDPLAFNPHYLESPIA
jgi:hypothetical protein